MSFEELIAQTAARTVSVNMYALKKLIKHKHKHKHYELE